MFNNLAGSSTASFSQSLFNSAFYIANNYEATKVIPNFHSSLDMLDMLIQEKIIIIMLITPYNEC